MTTSGTFLVIAILSCLSWSIAAVHLPKQDCILEPSGKQTCTVSMALDTAVHAKGKAPCRRTDVPCWCEKVKEYTNVVRKKNGVKKMLKLGTRSQLDNANRYAAKLSKMGRLRHQQLPDATREVGCQRWVGGENLAFNYERGDIARACVNMWIKSPGHFANLVREWFEEVVAGFHFDKDGRVYCVQTFSLFWPFGNFGPKKGPKCQKISPK